MGAARAYLLALLLCWAFAALADVAVPPLSGRVVDQTGTLSPQEKESLEQTLRNFEASKGSQIALLIVPTTAPETIEQYSIRVADQWKIGRKKVDDGAILVIAKDDRKIRMEVGYGLEGALNDATCKRIIDEIITPKFRQGDFAGGISDGVSRIIRVVDGEPLPTPEQRREDTGGTSSHLDPLNPFLIIAVIVVGGIFRGVLGRFFGSLATGGLVATIFWFVAASLALSGISGIIAFVITMFSDGMMSTGGLGRGGVWSGGGGLSGGGSGGGGFSGGGGGFGGGGASGSW